MYKVLIGILIALAILMAVTITLTEVSKTETDRTLERVDRLIEGYDR